MSKNRTPKVNRRARGTGSIFPDKRRGGWRARKKGHGEKWSLRHAECVEWLNTAAPPSPTVTLEDWSKRWLDSLDVREQSKATYEDYFRLRVLPSLGKAPVAQITAFDVEEAARQWGTGETGVGATTVRLTLGALSTCIQAAVRAGVIPQNPVRLARKPKPVASPHDVFTPDEMRTILAACLANAKLYPLAVCCVTGCRIGEAIALRSSDYDAASGKLSITRTVVIRTGGFGPPKSKNSNRIISVPRVIAPALAHAPDTIRYRTFLSRWEQLLFKLNLRYRGIHQLRHSVISHAIADKVPIANVARDAGDAVQTIVATYLHPVPGKGICDAMEGLYGGAEVAQDMGKRNKSKQNREK